MKETLLFTALPAVFGMLVFIVIFYVMRRFLVRTSWHKVAVWLLSVLIAAALLVVMTWGMYEAVDVMSYTWQRALGYTAGTLSFTFELVSQAIFTFIGGIAGLILILVHQIVLRLRISWQGGH